MDTRKQKQFLDEPSAEAHQVVEDYANDLRVIIKKRRKTHLRLEA